MSSNNLYGLDVIISDDDECFLLEINGIGSGMDGFVRVYGDDRIFYELYKRMVASSDDGVIFHSNKFLYPEKFEIVARKFGVVYRFFNNFPQEFNEPDASVGLVIGVENSHAEVSYLADEVIVNSSGAEAATWDKTVTNAIIKQGSMKKHIPPYIVTGSEIPLDSCLMKFLDEVDNDSILVHKPAQGDYGVGVKFYRKDKLPVVRNGHEEREQTYILQLFVQPALVKCSETGGYHAACARVIYYNEPIDAYWRLAKKPFFKDLCLRDYLLCSLSAGGHAERMENKHKDKVMAFASKIICEHEAFVEHPSLPLPPEGNVPARFQN